LPVLTTPGIDATPPPDIRLVAPSNVTLPSRIQPTAFTNDAALESTLRAIIGPEDADRYSVVVKDLVTGRGVAIDAARVYYAASVFKLWVMYEAFLHEAQGILDLDEKLVITPYYDSFGLGPRQTRLCAELTVDEALAAMMAISDNAAAVLLQDLVGAGNVNRSLAALGIVDSEVSEAMPLSARDAALLLESIARGQAVSRDASQAMLDLMTLETFDNGLVAGLPAGVQVAHKTGNWPDATHEAGIVFGPGVRYVIVVLTDRGYETAKTKAISTAVYEHLSTP
jgi:beta-lactamase class A